MSSKLRVTDRLRDVRGIVIRAGECTLERHSWGTQYSKPPSESLTQPSLSGFAKSSGMIGLQEDGRMEADGNASHTRVVLSRDPETMRCPSEEQAIDRTEWVCPSRGLLAAVPAPASQILMMWSSDPEMMWRPSGE